MPRVSGSPTGRGIDLQAWSIALIAAAPVILSYVMHFAMPPEGMSGTGFLQYDQAYYMANARALNEHGLGPLYGLPFSAYDTTPRVYFQPLTSLFALALKITAAPPGYIYAALGVVFSIVMFRVAVSLIDLYSGRRRDAPGVLAMFAVLWGGGIIVVTGVFAWSVLAPPRPWILDVAFWLDPADGYWFLNLGRNTLFTTEAFYHALFFAACVALIRQKYVAVLVLAAVLSASHPFSGLELPLILLTFAIAETLLDRKTAPPPWFLAGLAAILALHLAYYMFLLKRLSPEHALLEQQWSLPWTLPLRTSNAAYGPVFILAVAALFRYWRTGFRLPMRDTRFAMIWFAVAFALANHELIVAPRQPIHFTRGYVWTPLALIALPMLTGLFARCAAVRPRPVAAAVCGLLMLVVTLDNVVWFGRDTLLRAAHAEKPGIFLAADASKVLRRLAGSDMRDRLLLSNDPDIAYLATVYVPVRAWFSHRFNTPGAAEHSAQLQAFFQAGVEVPEWRQRGVVAVVDIEQSPRAVEILERSAFRPVEDDGRFRMLVRDAR